MQKGDKVYYARILDNQGVYDVYDLTIRTVAEDWFVGLDSRDKQAFLFDNSAIDKVVFLDRHEAVMKAQEAEVNAEDSGKKRRFEETYYEDY